MIDRVDSDKQQLAVLEKLSIVMPNFGKHREDMKETEGEHLYQVLVNLEQKEEVVAAVVVVEVINRHSKFSKVFQKNKFFYFNQSYRVCHQ
jgi:hypothetical protein